MIKSFQRLKIIDEVDNSDLFNILHVKVIPLLEFLKMNKVKVIDFLKESPLIQGGPLTLCNIKTIESVEHAGALKALVKDKIVLIMGTRFRERHYDCLPPQIVYPYVASTRAYNVRQYYFQTHCNLLHGYAIMPGINEKYVAVY